MKKFIGLIIFLLFIEGVGNIFGQTIIPGGTVNGNWDIAGSPYQVTGSIQIPDGQTLSVEPGVTVEFQGKYKLLVHGRLLAIGTVSDTITFTASNTIDGWRGIRFNDTPVTNDTSKIVFCLIQYSKPTGTGDDPKGGGLFLKNYSKVIISNNKIINNNPSWGGGIFCDNSNPTISHNTISNNTAFYGGGICCYYSNPVIDNNIINNNSINSIAHGGGGIFCEYSSPSITNNTISNNVTDYDGGGICCYQNSNPTISYNDINNNSAYIGGGISCSNNNNPVITNNIISSNEAIAQYGAGGGISCGESNPILADNTISGNFANNGNGGGIYIQGANTFVLKNNISNNNAKYGGGIYCSQCDPCIINNIISNNSASLNGGGVYLSSNNSSVTNNTISNNNAENGGALYCENNSNPIFNNTIMWGNTASISGPQLFLYDELSDPGFFYCDIQEGSVAFECNGNFYMGDYENNIDTDPLFVTPSAGYGTGYDGVNADWSLQGGSICINAGTTDTTGLDLSSTDIAGNPRIIDGRVDIGAHEFNNVFVPEIVSSSFSINIFPNPATEYIWIDPESCLPENYTIYDMAGRPVAKGAIRGKTKLNVNHLSQGVYVFKSVTCESKKIIVN